MPKKARSNSGNPAALVLGTVQLGLPYGAANIAGMPSEKEAAALLEFALSAGIRTFDTARAYGESEARLGRALGAKPDITIVTKLDPLAHIPENAGPNIAVRAARASIETSLVTLGRSSLDVVLLHRAAHRTQWGGSVWSYLCDQQQSGRIGRLGISAQSPAEVAAALQDPHVLHIQLPFNLLDWRWSQADVASHLQDRSDVTVHVRSVFLQGLLTSDAARWPDLDGVSSQSITAALDRLALQTGRLGRADLCIAFAGAQNWIDGIVVGCETIEQLQTNLELFDRKSLTEDELAICDQLLPWVSDALLDPTRWPA